MLSLYVDEVDILCSVFFVDCLLLNLTGSRVASIILARYNHNSSILQSFFYWSNASFFLRLRNESLPSLLSGLFIYDLLTVWTTTQESNTLDFVRVNDMQHVGHVTSSRPTRESYHTGITTERRHHHARPDVVVSDLA